MAASDTAYPGPDGKAPDGKPSLDGPQKADSKVPVDSTAKPDQPGKCTGAKECSDGLACTDDQCNGGKCANPIKGGHCLIGKKCYSTGQTHATCRICEPSKSKTSWTNRPSTVKCDDKVICSHNDRCQAGVCKGDAYTCGSLPCNTAKCNGKAPPPARCGLKPDTCMIGNKCQIADQVHPTDPCQACRPAVSTSAWSAANLATNTAASSTDAA